MNIRLTNLLPSTSDRKKKLSHSYSSKVKQTKKKHENRYYSSELKNFQSQTKSLRKNKEKYFFWRKKMEPSAAAAGFGHLFSWRHPATLDLNHAAYRYNQNMMEYYTCKSKFFLRRMSFWYLGGQKIYRFDTQHST